MVYPGLRPRFLQADNSLKRLFPTAALTLLTWDQSRSKAHPKPPTCFRVLMLSWIGLGSPTTVFVSLENKESPVLSLDIDSPRSPNKGQENELPSPFFKRKPDHTHLPRV